jgi:glycine oxidase
VGLLRDGAYRLCPALRGAAVTRSWAGTRPASSDMLPILGADPDEPALGYACGHSKNGILLAPATARVLAAWCSETPAPIDIGMLEIGRFESGEEH